MENIKKTVTFNEKKNSIFTLFVWSYAYRKARESDYEQYVLNRYRFQNRMKYAENLLKNVLEENYRNKVYNERFL